MDGLGSGRLSHGKAAQLLGNRVRFVSSPALFITGEEIPGGLSPVHFLLLP